MSALFGADGFLLAGTCGILAKGREPFVAVDVVPACPRLWSVMDTVLVPLVVVRIPLPESHRGFIRWVDQRPYFHPLAPHGHQVAVRLSVERQRRPVVAQVDCVLMVFRNFIYPRLQVPVSRFFVINFWRVWKTWLEPVLLIKVAIIIFKNLTNSNK